MTDHEDCLAGTAHQNLPGQVASICRSVRCVSRSLHNGNSGLLRQRLRCLSRALVLSGVDVRDSRAPQHGAQSPGAFLTGDAKRRIHRIVGASLGVPHDYYCRCGRRGWRNSSGLSRHAGLRQNDQQDVQRSAQIVARQDPLDLRGVTNLLEAESLANQAEKRRGAMIRAAPSQKDLSIAIQML